MTGSHTLSRIVYGLSVVALLLLVFLRGLVVPCVALDMSHDSAAAAAKEYFLAHQIQYGTELIENTGPLGFLQFPETYFSSLYQVKVLSSVFLSLLYTGLVYYLFRWFKNRRTALLWLFVNTLMYSTEGILGCEGVEYVFIIAAAWYLCDKQAPWRRAGIPCVVFSLALLALMKSTYLAAAFLVMGGACLQQIWQRRGATALGSGTLFAATLIGLWMLAGQSLENIPQFLRTVGEFSRGYQEAFALQEEPWVFFRGIAVLALLAAGVVWQIMRPPWRDQRPGIWAAEAFIIFVAWKHGFVRADDHTLIFFAFALTLAPLMVLARQPESATETIVRTPLSGGKEVLCVLIAATCLYGPSQLGNTAHMYTGKLVALLKWNAHIRHLDEELLRNKATGSLPHMREIIGDTPVDGFNLSQGALLLNELQYRPRPVPITFAACNEYLMEQNAAFYRNPKTAPQYVIAAISSIDGRLPAQDDALALTELLANYTFICAESGLLLLRHRDEPFSGIIRTPLKGGGRFLLKGQISVPRAPSGELVWCTIDIKYSFLGRIRNFLYKPPALGLVVVFSDGRHDAFRFIPSAARAGFIVNPLLQSTGDLWSLYNSPTPLQQQLVAAMRLICREEDKKYFAPEFETRFTSIRIPLQHLSGDTNP